MNLLQDDKRDLKACSSTCKAMFASTRHLIHQTLHITRETDQMILTPKKKKQHGRRGTNAVELRYVSFMAERDLLKYTRHVNVHMGFMFSPGILAMGSHVQHLQSLDRVHTLTIHSFDAWLWPPMYNTSLSQFYPTLTTLALYSPTGCYRLMLQFALQFPNLENLTLESLRTHIPPDLSKTLVVTQSPPLCGHLRCAGIDRNVPGWLVRQFAFDLPNGINFRSIEFQDVHWEHGQHILNGCASSLEEFALTVHAAVSHGENESLSHSFRATKTEHTDSHLQKPLNWATSTSGKTGHFDPLYSVLRFPICPDWRQRAAGQASRPSRLLLSPNSFSNWVGPRSSLPGCLQASGETGMKLTGRSAVSSIDVRTST